MIRLFLEGGPYMTLLALLAGIVLVLSAKKAIDLFVRSDRKPEVLARGLDAILFWGCVSAVIGFLGQFTGGYLSLMAIRRAGLVNPALLAQGIALSLLTTLFGLAILIFAALVWFGLRCRLGRIAKR
jgi:biopolymer transport protein ExbB/TolQ